MVRAALFVGFGFGYAAAPHVAWLVAMVVLAALLPPGWRRRRPLAVRIPTVKDRHAHYCLGCDRQWPHEGEGMRCIQHWASRCPECRAATEPIARSA